MKIYKSLFLLTIFGFLGVLGPVFVSAETLPKPAAEVSVNTKGIVSIKNAVVFYIIGSTLFARTNWDDAYIQWSLRSTDNMQINKKFGGSANLSDIKVGHVLDVEGQILLGSQGLDISVSKITDQNLENEDGSFFGTVYSADNEGKVFALKMKSGKDITVSMDANTYIKKGTLIYPGSKIRNGDTVLSATGIYHQPTETLKADKIELKMDYSVLTARNFQGTLKSVSSTELPTSIVVNVNGFDYTVYLEKNASILTKWRAKTSLQRYLIGDTVRFYGAIRNTVNQDEVDAEVLRNLNL